MSQKERFTVIPLRDVVVFPHMITPIFVGRPRSVKALHIANTTDKRLCCKSSAKSSAARWQC